MVYVGADGNIRDWGVEGGCHNVRLKSRRLLGAQRSAPIDEAGLLNPSVNVSRWLVSSAGWVRILVVVMEGLTCGRRRCVYKTGWKAVGSAIEGG
jgi:hypothetical protein